ncbi:MAG TPA: hypothetical protein VIA06_18065 [Candidatus Dormibacteraeota bacterium]|jgi:hypothetical protein|nr:hypothetical protein [Candidatus Dormibacteraeota bacterium]
MAAEVPGPPDDRPGGGDSGSGGPVDRRRPPTPDAPHELTPAEQASIHQWISKRRMASAERLGLSRSEAERLENDFDGDLKAYVESRRSQGEELPEAVRDFDTETA